MESTVTSQEDGTISSDHSLLRLWDLMLLFRSLFKLSKFYLKSGSRGKIRRTAKMVIPQSKQAFKDTSIFTAEWNSKFISDMPMFSMLFSSQ
jgi:hypothetical protein